MVMRGVRGAITAEANTEEAMLRATRRLLREMIGRNRIQPEDVASVLFTTTPDLNAVFPAVAARQLGWLQVPLMGAQEAAVKGALEKCIRVLIHWNTDLPPDQIQHVYLDGAVNLRGTVPPIPADEPE
jgi:chorismate mutase